MRRSGSAPAAGSARGGDEQAGYQSPPGRIVFPFELDRWPIPATPIDQFVAEAWRARGIRGAYPCSDEVFCRRVFLDVIGTLPRPEETVAFLRETRPDKRAALIEALLARPEYADYWAMKWCDLLRVKAEFPINLWPNAVQAYHRWILDALWANQPYDAFVRELLCSSGSNFRVPPVNFYRGIQGREPATIAEAVALTFMGSRMAAWPAAYREGLTTVFSQVAYKKTQEWKEEIVTRDPAATGPLEALLPDGTRLVVPAEQDPRRAFADWLIRPDNPWFGTNIANRVWSWLLGRGIIHEPDDLRADNPAANPALLAWLTSELAGAQWDLRHLFRLILNSRTYQQSSIPRTDHPDGAAQFAWYPVRRLEAEVLADALRWILGSGDTYSSPIPEPFTWIPEDQRSIMLADGSITSPFLEMFGRPARDSGLESERDNQSTEAQRLYLLNSGVIRRRLENCRLLRELVDSTRRDRPALIRSVYLTVVSRPPDKSEQSTVEQHFATPGLSASQAAIDLVWALINSKEFLFRH